MLTGSLASLTWAQPRVSSGGASSAGRNHTGPESGSVWSYLGPFSLYILLQF